MNETIKRQVFSGSGLAVVAVLLVLSISLGNSLFQGARVDLTENNLYTLSEGTHSLLDKIDEPIHLNFFYSREVAQGVPAINTYATRVREMLEEMEQAADGGLKLTVIDPEPFSDEEDRAVKLGVQGVSINGGADRLYFGLAGSNAVGETESIPFFAPEREALLEYDLAKLIYQLNQARKPVVGLLSSLPVDGGFDPQTMQMQPAWVAVDQLRQFFQVKTLQKGVSAIPEDVELLLLIHPTELSAGTRYAIDQFVLGGGKALVFVDPHAEVAPQGPQGSPTVASSNLDGLLKAWGVRLRGEEVVGDAANALQVRLDPRQPPFFHYAMLRIDAGGMNQEDVVTRGVKSVNLSYAGILEPVEGATTTFMPLIQSSERAMPVASFRASLDAASLQKDFKPTGERYVIAARIRGKAKSAFPEGRPAVAKPKDESGAQEPKKTPHIAESAEPINVVVVADADLLADRLWVRTQRFLGQRISQAWAGNGDFLINAVDNLLGSSDLIAIRSRATYSRPFERIEALKRAADRQFRDKEEELTARLRETEQKLSELQGRKSDGNTLILSPEQERELARFQQAKLDIRKELRDVRHQLNKDIEGLEGILKFVNIGLVPLLLVMGAMVAGWARRRTLNEQGGRK